MRSQLELARLFLRFARTIQSFATLFLLSFHELIYFLYAAAFTLVRTTINGNENKHKLKRIIVEKVITTRCFVLYLWD